MIRSTVILELGCLLLTVFCGCDGQDNDFSQQHPLARYSLKEVHAGKIPGKKLSYLRKYARRQLAARNDNELIKSVKAIRGDFGIPEKLPDNPELIDFLKYKADHFRVSYLHLGREPDRRNLAFLWIAGALRDLWIYHGDEDAKNKYITIMKYALRNLDKLTDKQLCNKINDKGLLNPWHPLMKSAVYYYARLYEATGDEYYAKRTCLILTRFGEVLDKWKLYYRTTINGKKGHGVFILDKTVPQKFNKDGLWGWWGNVHDLTHSIPLIDAYTLVKTSKTFRRLPSDKKALIVNGLLHKIVQKNLYFPFQPLHNQDMNRIYGMIYFGKALASPEYIHIAVRWIDEVLHLGYRRDGFWCEGTVAYGIGITRGIIKALKALENYSDPDNYCDPVDGRHFVNFDPEKEFGYDLRMIKKAFNKLALPNARSISLEDSTWNSKNQFFCPPPRIARPFLLGASGLGMLGFGKDSNQTRLYLHWDDSSGHDHYDMLGIALWAKNQEICSETGYRGLHDWNISTAAHNTVVIDGKNQPGMSNTDYIVKKREDTVYGYPHYTFGKLWWGNRSRYDDSGELLLWDATEEDVQVMKVDGLKAFKKSDGVKKYQRTLVLVKTGEETFYIVDIFKVEGGLQHDWMLHGNLEKRYSITILDETGAPLKLERRKGKIGKYLENLKAVKSWNKNFIVEFNAKDGAIFRSLICGGKETDVIVAEGPSIRLSKEPECWGKPGYSSVNIRQRLNSEYLVVRRKGPCNTFIAVHEAFIGTPCVKRVVLSGTDDAVNVRVELKDQVDIIEYSEGWIKYSGNKRTVIFGDRNLSGNVLAVTSVDSGNKENSFTVCGNLYGKVKSGEVIVILDGDGRRHPYIIKEIVPLEGHKTKVLTKGETGMLLKKDLMIMTFFPSWDITGRLTYKIPGKNTIQEDP